jgi:hypothetical protein
MSTVTPLTRTLKEGINWTKNWQTKYPKLSKAFLIPADDLLACLKEMGVKIDANGNLVLKPGEYEPCLRVYLAIEGSDATAETGLMIVGTSSTDGVNYKDIIGTDGDGDGAINGSGIYDFTRPCPSNCDPSSPLYHKTKMVFSK